MLIQLQETLTKYNLIPKGVIHVGAHWAEEHEDYLKCGIERFVYIEPCESAFRKIVEEKLAPMPVTVFSDGMMFAEYNKIKCFRVACSSEQGELPMYVSHQNQGQSNSLLKPELHLQQHPEVIFNDVEVVKVIPLDSLPLGKEKYDMLVMDVQGFEGEVILGAYETLKNINIVYSEINRGQTYSGNIEIDELDGLLSAHGFTRVETHWPSPNWTWGDAIYIRNENYTILDKDLIDMYKKIITNNG